METIVEQLNFGVLLLWVAAGFGYSLLTYIAWRVFVTDHFLANWIAPAGEVSVWREAVSTFIGGMISGGVAFVVFYLWVMQQ